MKFDDKISEFKRSWSIFNLVMLFARAIKEFQSCLKMHATNAKKILPLKLRLT